MEYLNRKKEDDLIKSFIEDTGFEPDLAAILKEYERYKKETSLVKISVLTAKHGIPEPTIRLDLRTKKIKGATKVQGFGWGIPYSEAQEYVAMWKKNRRKRRSSETEIGEEEKKEIRL